MTARPSLLLQPLDLPADRLIAAVGAMSEPALLEGGAGFGEAGRWSLYSARPRLVFEANESRWSVRHGDMTLRSGIGDPLAPLSSLIEEFRLARTDESPDPGDPPFLGGLIGFFGYDLAPRLESLPRKAPTDSRLPVIRFGLYDWAVCVDHQSGDATLAVFDLLDQGGLRARRDDLRAALDRRPEPHRPTRLATAIRANFTRDAYLETVARALEYIAAGDIFQVNLSQRFSASGDIDPFDLFLRLRRRSPSPFGAFLRWGDLAVVSASPESFYKTRGNAIVTRPIKGTRPRGTSAEDDARLASELASSPKDRAELTMIVDLERNDLGRVCRYGSVRVSEAMAIESFAQVHHLVATVEGRLRQGIKPIDVVRAVFPGGSITGAPKIRAMEIIDELEPTRRSLYTGAIGYFGRGGASSFNIAIRTILVEGDRLSYQVGGGIVADSDPEAEFEETLHKGRGLREVIEGWGRLS